MMIYSGNMSESSEKTLGLILGLKRSINPATGRGFRYEEIGQLLGISKQAVNQRVHDTAGLCPTCLRKLKKIKVEA